MHRLPLMQDLWDIIHKLPATSVEWLQVKKRQQQHNRSEQWHFHTINWNRLRYFCCTYSLLLTFQCRRLPFTPHLMLRGPTVNVFLLLPAALDWSSAVLSDVTVDRLPVRSLTRWLHPPVSERTRSPSPRFPLLFTSLSSICCTLCTLACQAHQWNNIRGEKEEEGMGGEWGEGWMYRTWGGGLQHCKGKDWGSYIFEFPINIVMEETFRWSFDLCASTTHGLWIWRDNRSQLQVHYGCIKPKNCVTGIVLSHY